MDAFLHHFWYEILGHHLRQLGLASYAMLAVVVMLEGPTATLIGAAAAASGFLQPVPVFIAAACGNLTGDLLWHLLGRVGDVRWLARCVRWFGVRREDLDIACHDVSSNARKIIFVAKLTLVFTIPALVATGLARVPLRRWLPVDMTAEMIWTGSLVLIGYHLTRAVGRVERGLELLPMFACAAFIAAASHYLARLRKRRTSRKGEITERANG